jgi:hypothetical protein
MHAEGIGHLTPVVTRTGGGALLGGDQFMHKTTRAPEKGGFQCTPAMLLRRAYPTTHRAFDSLFIRRGMTADPFVLLMTLSEEEGINQRELARKVSSDPNTITAMLRLLENHGYLRRKDRPGDGRAWTVYLTPAGRGSQSGGTGGK